jgi:twinkle protein
MTKKTKCPDCGSEDNLVEFDNGTSYCFTPQCKYNEGRNNQIRVTPKALNDRDIREATCAKYGVGFGEDGYLWAPYYRDGHIVAYKVRKPDKVFYWEGNASKATLFGLQACSGDRRLIIVEGELDALAAYQMTGYPAVSIRTASTAVADIKANLEFIESYEYVYVCTDMDVPGRKAAQQIMEVLRPGKGYLVNLPEGFKDACDMSSKKMGTEFKQALFAARPINVEGVIPDDALRAKALELFSNETKRRGVTTGFESLDYLLGGFRPGEVTLIVGGTGVGKTAIVRQLAVNLASQQLPVFFIPLEMNPEVVLLQMAEMVLRGNVFTSPEFSVQKIEQTILTLTEQVKFFDHFGTIDPIKLVNTIEYVCRTNDIKYVVLDHISAVVNGGEDERRGVDQAIAGLKSVALRLGLHILVVSHISRSKDDPDDNHPTLSKIRHSAGLAQYSDQVLGVQRARSGNQTEIKTLKVSRLWGQYGTAHLEWIDYCFQEKQTKGEKNAASVFGGEPNHGSCDDSNHIRTGEGLTDGLLTSNVDDIPPSLEGESGLYSNSVVRAVVNSPVNPVGGLDGVTVDDLDSIDFNTDEHTEILQIDETDSIEQNEQERSERRLRQRFGEGNLPSQREDVTQQGEGSIHSETSNVHPRLLDNFGEQGYHGGSEGTADRSRPSQVQGSEGQLPPDSGVLGKERSRTLFHLSEGGWTFESQEP